MSKLIYGSIIICIVFCFACKNKAAVQLPEVKLSDEDIQTIKGKYSVETINYFYEVAFYNEGKDTLYSNLYKWKNNPLIYVYGTPTKSHLKRLDEAIALVNSLNLPINLSITDNKDKATIAIYYGNAEYLMDYFDKVETFAGHYENTCSEGEIVSAKIAIKKFTLLSKEVIFEELMQSLGLPGDSYSYTNSIFFEHPNTAKYVTDIDKDILRLLYDSNIPYNLSLKEFERAFSDILFNVNTAEKVKDYVTKNKISKETLEDIRDYFFNKGGFNKFPKKVEVYIKGNYEKSDSLHVVRCIQALNSINKNINLELISKPKGITRAGIYLNFRKVKRLDKAVKYHHVFSTGLGTMIHKLVSSYTHIFYIESAESKEIKQKYIVETIYQSLGHTKRVDIPDLYSIKDNKIYFGEKYKEMMNIIYSDAFATGYKLTDLNKLISSLQTK